MRGHSALLSALVERWRPQTHTFYLPVGEVTLTLEDVSYILGLLINGEAVTGRSDSSHQFLLENCIACFGQEPGPEDHVLGKLQGNGWPTDTAFCLGMGAYAVLGNYTRDQLGDVGIPLA
ncbi:hypothetical protein AHAS_Ahas20G0212200 [Arachis hypogaea]